MKLMMVTTYQAPGNRLLEAARGAGHEVVLAAPQPAAEMVPALAEFGARYHVWAIDRTGLDPLADLRALAAVHALFRAERPDVVLVSQVKAVLVAPVAARLARVPRVVALINGLGMVFDDVGFGATWRARVARVGYKHALRWVDAAVFHNADDPAFLLARGILGTRAAWRVVPGSGVDLDRFAARPLPTDVPTFTLVSRLLVSKGVREFAAAARTLRARYPAVRFQLVGQLEAAGHPDAIAAAEVDAWVGDGALVYLGFRSDIAAVLAATTVFVLPSYREGMPRTNLEALAIGRPVVTTDAPGCRDTVEDGVNGFLVPIKDAVALADRLERYLVEPELARRHGEASRRLAERKFDIHRVNRLMLDTLGLFSPTST